MIDWFWSRRGERGLTVAVETERDDGENELGDAEGKVDVRKHDGVSCTVGLCICWLSFMEQCGVPRRLVDEGV